MSVVMSSETRNHHDARCPRCGYDLRGVIDTWKESCQLLGVCSECGLEFEWAELLSPRRRPPTWLFEYARGGPQLTRAFFATILAVLNPWFFWKRQRMSFVINWRRIVLLIGIIASVEYLLFAASSASISSHIWKNYTTRPGTKLVPDYEECVVRGFVLPFSQRSRVSISRGGKTMGVWQSPWFARLWRTQEDVPKYFVLFVILLPCVFVVLPVSRRRAKVRWAHIGRIFAYSLLIPALLLAFMILQARIAYLDPGTYAYRPQNMYIDRCHWATVAAFPMVGVFWGVAIKRYLRMDEAWKVGLSVIVTAFMLATVVMYFFNREMIAGMISRILFPFGA